jgi:two-component system OmpR family response regulator
MDDRAQQDPTADVLVVDDEQVVRRAVRKVLERAGFRVATVSDGASALAHPAVASCRLVLCDLVLLEGSGIDVLHSLARRRPGLPVVMITGYATREHEEEALAAGAAGFLPKPFESSELLDAVRRVLHPEGLVSKEDRS